MEIFWLICFTGLVWFICGFVGTSFYLYLSDSPLADWCEKLSSRSSVAERLVFFALAMIGGPIILFIGNRARLKLKKRLEEQSLRILS